MLATGLHLSCRSRALSPLRRQVIQPGLLTWPDVHNDAHPRSPNHSETGPRRLADCRALPSLQLAVAVYRRVPLGRLPEVSK